MRMFAFLLLGGVGVGPHWLTTTKGSTSGLLPAAEIFEGEPWWTEVVSRFQPGSSPAVKSDYGNAALEFNIPKLQVNGKHLPESGISATAIAIGLLHLAATQGDAESQLALAFRYKHGKWICPNGDSRVV